MKVAFTEPGVAGDTSSPSAIATVGVAPETSIEAIGLRLGTWAMTPHEFQEDLGRLPSDEEG